jgi:hypothetical protein
MTTSEISAGVAAKFVRRFNKLRDQRSTVDYELAGLSHEIRQEFPKGATGDLQTRLWMCHHLDVYGGTANMLVRSARAFVLFPTIDEWRLLGGWRSVGFMLGFKAADRRKIAKHSLSLAAERERPIGYATVRNISAVLGCQQIRGGSGRPNRLKIEEDLGILRAFVESMVEEDRLVIEDLTDGVLDALKNTKLSAIANSLGG